MRWLWLLSPSVVVALLNVGVAVLGATRRWGRLATWRHVSIAAMFSALALSYRADIAGIVGRVLTGIFALATIWIAIHSMREPGRTLA